MNERFLKKALSLLPKVKEKRADVFRTVELKKENGEIIINEAKEYNKTVLSKGESVVLDFGNHFVGYLSLKFASVGSHADAPVLLKLQFAENPSELFEKRESYNGWICTGWIQQEQIFVDIVPSEMKLSRRYAFRYVLAEVIDISSKFSLVIENAFVTAVSSADEERLEEYKNSDIELEELDKIACRTLHDCMQTVFEDGPKRDRRLWLGDLRIQALANYLTYKNNDMVKACLYLFASLPLSDGRIAACLFLEPKPEADDTVMFDYSLFFAAVLLDYFKETNDIETLRELSPTAFLQIELALKNLDENGVVKDSDKLGWCFIDWNLELNKQASAHGVLLYTINCAAEIYEALGENEKKEHYCSLHEKLKKAANEYLWDRRKLFFTSGSEKQISWASQVWLILGGAVSDDTARDILSRLENEKSALKMVTPYMYHNYIDALLMVGERDKALSALKSYWGGMVKNGADTFWELYNPENPNESPYGGMIVNSFCHAWSCGPAYFLRKYFR